MTVDDVIRDMFRGWGWSEDQITEMERNGDVMDPNAAAAGLMEVTPSEAAAIRLDFEALTKLPREKVFEMLEGFQARARRESVSN